MSLSVNVEAVRFADPKSVAARLKDAITARLAREGINTAPNQSIEFEVSYSELKGDDVRYVESQTFVPRARPQGPTTTATETKDHLQLSIRAAGDPNPIWRGSLAAGASYVVTGGTSDENLRNEMFADLLESIHKAELPYFIPRDRTAIPLPMVIQP